MMRNRERHTPRSQVVVLAIASITDLYRPESECSPFSLYSFPLGADRWVELRDQYRRQTWPDCERRPESVFGESPRRIELDVAGVQVATAVERAGYSAGNVTVVNTNGNHDIDYCAAICPRFPALDSWQLPS